MNQLQAILAIVGGLVLLSVTAAGVWAVFRSTAREATEKRLRAERDDYLSRLNYIEPRHRALEQQNELLLALHNPTEQLDTLGTQSTEILRLLQAQSQIMQQIDRSLYRPRGATDDE